MTKPSQRKVPKGFDEATLNASIARIKKYERVEDVARDLCMNKKKLSAAIRSYAGVAQIQDLHTKPKTIDTRYKAAAKMAKKCLTLQQIADHFEVSKQAVSVWLSKAGFDKEARKTHLAQKEREASAKLSKGMNLVDVQKKTGLPKTKVKSIAKELKLTRTPHKAPKRLPQYDAAIRDLKAGLSAKEVAAKHEIAYVTVGRWAREMSKTPASKPANQKD